MKPADVRPLCSSSDRIFCPESHHPQPDRQGQRAVQTALCFLCQLHHIRARVAAAATASRCTSRCWSRHREQRSSPTCRRAALLHDNVYKPRVLRLDVMRASRLRVDCKRVQYAHKQGKARESVERSAAVCPLCVTAYLFIPRTHGRTHNRRCTSPANSMCRARTAPQPTSQSLASRAAHGAPALVSRHLSSVDGSTDKHLHADASTQVQRHFEGISVAFTEKHMKQNINSPDSSATMTTNRTRR